MPPTGHQRAADCRRGRGPWSADGKLISSDLIDVPPGDKAGAKLANLKTESDWAKQRSSNGQSHIARYAVNWLLVGSFEFMSRHIADHVPSRFMAIYRNTIYHTQIYIVDRRPGYTAVWRFVVARQDKYQHRVCLVIHA